MLFWLFRKQLLQTKSRTFNTAVAPLTQVDEKPFTPTGHVPSTLAACAARRAQGPFDASEEPVIAGFRRSLTQLFDIQAGNVKEMWIAHQVITEGEQFSRQQGYITGALIITNTIVGVPYYVYSIMGPQTYSN